MRSLLLSLLMGLSACSGSSAPAPDPAPVMKPFAMVYTTSVAGARMAPSQITLGAPSDVNFYKVSLNGESYQTVDGFGMAITQASCYNLLVMPAADRLIFANIFWKTICWKQSSPCPMTSFIILALQPISGFFQTRNLAQSARERSS